jgi:hypothetical protein
MGSLVSRQGGRVSYTNAETLMKLTSVQKMS